MLFGADICGTREYHPCRISGGCEKVCFVEVFVKVTLAIHLRLGPLTLATFTSNSFPAARALPTSLRHEPASRSASLLSSAVYSNARWHFRSMEKLPENSVPSRRFSTKIVLKGSCHKRQKPQVPTPQAPIRNNRQTRTVANAKGRNRNTNLTNPI